MFQPLASVYALCKLARQIAFPLMIVALATSETGPYHGLKFMQSYVSRQEGPERIDYRAAGKHALIFSHIFFFRAATQSSFLPAHSKIVLSLFFLFWLLP